MTTAEKRRAGRALLRVLGARAAAFQALADVEIGKAEPGEKIDTTNLVVAAMDLFGAARDVVLHHEPKRRG